MAISYRPSPTLHEALREASERTGKSMQQVIDEAVTEHLGRQQRRSPAEIARDFKARHQQTYKELETR